MTWWKVVGGLLVALGILGFLTVADDLRHVGELLGVGTVLLAGVLLLIAGSVRSRAGRREPPRR